MRAVVLAVPLLLACQALAQSPPLRSIREFGVVPDGTPAENKARLQAAIDWAAARGAALFVEPSDEPYPVDGGLVLRRNASLVGVHGPVGRGTKHPTKDQPVGSVFAVTDEREPFLTVEGATQVRGIQFFYPRQSWTDPARVIAYPPTVRASSTSVAQGVTLSCLTFQGEFVAMDFRCSRQVPCEQVLVEHCYGYPLSGQFVLVDHCYDIPRLLHCHVNPANMRLFGRTFAPALIDSVVARRTFAYDIDHADNAVLMDVFAFGTWGGARLGAATYGQLTSFNFDCVTVGLHVLGDGSFNRNWQVAQGSVIANVEPDGRIENVHPIVVEGQGHVSLANVEAFSGPNGALTTVGASRDFLVVRGSGRRTVSLVGCRMRNYTAKQPITVENPEAIVQVRACVDGDEEPLDGDLRARPRRRR